MAQPTAQDIMQSNAEFMHLATERNFTMAQQRVTHNQQLIDLEMDSVPGWVKYIDLNVDLFLNIQGTTAPTLSPFAPWNFFRSLEISLGGGPFQSVSPYFYYLRQKSTNYGYSIDRSADNYGYAAASVYSVPTPVIGENHWKFTIRVPLQLNETDVYGLIPLGDAATKLRIKLNVANAFYGTDQYLSPLFGGSGVTVSMSQTNQSFVQPVLYYLTSPATRQTVNNPIIGMVSNVQEKATSFIGTNTKTPIKFPDPYRYLRLWHIVIDGTGAPTSSAVNGFELDFAPGYPQYEYSSKSALSSYYIGTRERFGSDLPTGVFLFDLYTGSNPFQPNGTQTIDGSKFSTMQTQISVEGSTNVLAPAKIITFAEALAAAPF